MAKDDAGVGMRCSVMWRRWVQWMRCVGERQQESRREWSEEVEESEREMQR